jgi:hypothetical protein
VTTWTSDELTRIDDADEMHIAATRRDGSLRTPVIVWMVRFGDDLYTRSVNGPDAAWFRGTRANHNAKYRRYSGPVASITSPLARSATLKVIPQQ